MNARPDPARPRDLARPLLRGLAAAVMVLTLAACGLRAETPPATEPSPDAVEQVRARTVADSLALVRAATAAALLPDGAVDPVAPVLVDVAGFSTQHADELGGVYVSGLPAPTDSPTSTAPTPSTSTVSDVLAQLAEATRTALADADAVTDGPLARLVASVATSRGELTTRLAHATGVEVPSLVPDETAAVDPSPSASPGVDGLATDDLGTLALVHDQAGYGFEVIAAKLSGDQRTAASSAAASHRSRSEDWASAAGIDGSAQDPRRASYTLPSGLDDPAVATALARTLETSVADAYANAIAQAAPGDRSTLVDGLRRATDDAALWGATPVPFPGLPERAQQPTG
jgi:predicted small lipoprotein YifL